jgi:voltage-gated hydrogen channel 1
LSEGCNPTDSSNPEWLEALALVSITITTILLLEIPITLWAIGFSYYNPLGDTPHATLHLFDALVITTTFILEFVLKGKERELAGLLIVLRLWRIVKLVGGVLFRS